MKLFDTESLCPVCMQRIPAFYEDVDGAVYLNKTCPEHGNYQVLFWRDADLYRKFSQTAVHALCNHDLSKEDKGCPFDCGLCEQHEGGTCTAVLEITYRCNMCCPVCFADTEKARFDPDLDEIRGMYETANRAGDFPSIQLSGGEPTVREDLPAILKLGKELGFPHIQVNTNGLRLAKETDYAQTLKDAGADLIYLQFDGCDDEIYQIMRGKDLFAIKERAIANCAKVGLGVMLVPTVSPATNLHKLGQIVDFAKAHMPTIRGIHFQPMSYFGRFPGRMPENDSRCSLSDVLHALEAQTELKIAHFSARKRYDPHCAFSGLFYLPESGTLQAITDDQAPTPAPDTPFAKNTNDFTNAHWRMPAQQEAHNKMEAFRKRLADYSLSISGMGFQDIWNVDIGRLKGCCVHVISAKGQAVPLCAFHLTSESGERLYENR